MISLGFLDIKRNILCVCYIKFFKKKFEDGTKWVPITSQYAHYFKSKAKTNFAQFALKIMGTSFKQQICFYYYFYYHILKLFYTFFE